MAFVTGQFNDSYKPVMDGVASVIRNYAYWLNRNFGDSYLITPAFPQYEDAEEFKVLRYFSTMLPRRRPYRLGIPQLDFAFRKKINRIPFSIVHAHCPFSSGQIAFQLARRRGIPIVATFHSKYYDDFKEAVRLENITQYFVKRVIGFYNSCDAVWTVNRATVNTLKSYGYKGRVDVVVNGTDFAPVHNRKDIGAQFFSEMGLTSDTHMLLFVGQHIWQKNLKMLVESLTRLKTTGIRFRMFFAGRGYAEKELKNKCGEMGLDKHVKFLGQITDRDMLRKLYAAASLFIFPSMYDNAPLVIREAAAAGCPSLLVRGSNSAEGIIDGYNGFLADNNPDAFAYAIRDILNHSEKCRITGQNALKTLYRSWEQIVNEVAERYLDIIKMQRHSRAL